MITFAFNAICNDESLPIEVSLPYKPGKQTQRARRMAVGELLAVLEIEEATVDASGEDRVKIATPAGTWIIAEARTTGAQRSRF